MLTNVAEDCLSSPRALILVTRPCAGETMTSRSAGGSRRGSRKKYSIKAVTMMKGRAMSQYPRSNSTSATSAGKPIYGNPSRAIFKCSVLSSKIESGDACLSFPRPRPHRNQLSGSTLPFLVSCRVALLVLQHHGVHFILNRKLLLLEGNLFQLFLITRIRQR